MSNINILELPGEVYNSLIKAAKSDGVSPAEWVAAHLPAETNTPARFTPEEIEAANAKLRETIFTLGYATGSDNESIDRDLAAEYGADHEPASLRRNVK